MALGQRSTHDSYGANMFLRFVDGREACAVRLPTAPARDSAESSS